MKELLVVLALCGYQIFPIADIISIQDDNDCKKVENTLCFFWTSNQRLVPLLEREDPLSESENLEIRKSLKKNTSSTNQSLIKEYLRNKEEFIATLERSEEYVKSHMQELEGEMGDKAKSLLNFLYRLDDLIYVLAQ